MRQRIILFASVGLNAALAVVMLASRHAPVTAERMELSRPTVVTNAGRTLVVMRRQFFSWREVESPDYPTYITKLRDIGCPEPTIRDIIIAEVNQMYAAKRLKEIPSANEEWWRSTPSTNFLQFVNGRIRSMDQERRSLLVLLLGPDWESGEVNLAAKSFVSLHGQILGDLPKETKQAVEDISASAAAHIQEYLDAQQKAGKTADPTELARIRQSTRTELSKVLAPPQLEEYLLRYSQTATDLRQRISGFEVTPDEFRKLFRVYDSVDQQVMASFTNSGVMPANERALIEKQKEDALVTALGSDRFQQFRQAQLQRETRTNEGDGGPELALINSGSSLGTLYAINQATTQELNRIWTDPNLSDEEKSLQMKAVQEQMQAARAQILGSLSPGNPPLPPGASPAQVHSFSPGETLDGIANQYGVSLGSLLTANPNLNVNSLGRGTTINIPAPK